MIASTIGKTFLKAYNNRFNTSYLVKDFFEQVFVPLFFDYPKYMRTGGNSPLENPKFKRGKRPDQADRAVRIEKTITKIESDPAASSPIGYPSNDILATTSGQVSNLGLETRPEDVYYSWIGGGLGIYAIFQKIVVANGQLPYAYFLCIIAGCFRPVMQILTGYWNGNCKLRKWHSWSNLLDKQCLF